MRQDERIFVKSPQRRNVIRVASLHESDDSRVVGEQFDVIFALDHFEVLLLRQDLFKMRLQVRVVLDELLADAFLQV